MIFRREWTNQIQSGGRHDFADQCQDQFHFTFGGRACGFIGSLGENGLLFHVVRNAEIIEHFFDMDLACAVRHIGNRLRTKQGFLHRLGRGNVRFLCSRSNSESDAGASQVGSAGGSDLAGFDQLIDDLGCKNRKVKRFVGLNSLLHGSRRVEINSERTPDRLLALRTELVNDALHSIRTHHAETVSLSPTFLCE